jgi:hypothetical protein
MLAGLPMIVTDVGGNAEAVVDGETGLGLRRVIRMRWQMLFCASHRMLSFGSATARQDAAV